MNFDDLIADVVVVIPGEPTAVSLRHGDLLATLVYDDEGDLWAMTSWVRGVDGGDIWTDKHVFTADEVNATVRHNCGLPSGNPKASEDNER